MPGRRQIKRKAAPKKKEFHLRAYGGEKIPYDPLSYKSIDAALEAFDRLSDAQRIKLIHEHPELAYLFRKPGKK